MNEREIKILLKLKDEMSSTLDKVEKTTSKVGGKMVSIFKVGVAGAVAAVGAALGKLALDAFNFSSQANKGQLDFQAQLGITEQDALRLGETAKNVYKNNFGSNLADVNAALITTSQQLEAANINVLQMGDSLEPLVEDAFRLQDAFQVGVSESTQAAATLMEQFGLSGEEAMDVIAFGFHNGLNASDDFLDTINEYSVQFSAAGASAEEFFGFLSEGQAAGVLGTDRIADSFKEFTQVALADVAKSDAFEVLGMSQAKLAREVDKGAKSGVEAYQEVLAAVLAIEDPILRGETAVALFGTMMEDITLDSVNGLLDLEDALDGYSSATEKLDTQYQDFGSMMSGLWRGLVVEMAPFTDKLLEIASVVAPILIAVVGDVVQRIKEFGGTLQGIVESPFVQTIIAEMGVIFEQIGAKLSEFAAFFEENWDDIQLAVQKVIEFLKPYLEIGLSFVIGLFKTMASIIGGVIDIVMGVVKVFISVINGDFEGLKEGVSRIWEGIKGIISGVINGIANTVSTVIDTIATTVEKVFNTVSGIVSDIWGGIEDTIGGAIEGAKGIVTGAVDEIKRIIEEVLGKIDGIVTAAKELPGKVGGFLDDLNPTTGSGFLAGVFADGGIVGGNSFTGDKLLAGVNSGEMILNPQQQARLFNFADGGGDTFNNNNSRNIQQVNIYSNQDFDMFLADLQV